MPVWQAWNFNITTLTTSHDAKYRRGAGYLPTARPSARNFDEWFHHVAGLTPEVRHQRTTEALEDQTQPWDLPRAGEWDRWPRRPRSLANRVALLRQYDGATEVLNMYPSALMVVSSKRVRARPRSYYEALRRQVQGSVKPVECHYLERSWYYVFNCDLPCADVGEC